MKKPSLLFIAAGLVLGGLVLTGCPSNNNPTAPNPPTATPTSTRTATPVNTPTVTVTSTPTASATSTATDTQTSTPTDTATVAPTDTPTSTPTPCATLGSAGDSNHVGSGSTCAALAAPFTLSTTVYAYQMEIYASNQPDNTGIYVGIYSDNAGAPGTLLASAGPTGLLTANSWNVIPINGLYLSAGNYWVAAASAGGSGSQWPFSEDGGVTTGLFYNGCTNSLPWPTSSNILTGQPVISLTVDYKSCN